MKACQEKDQSLQTNVLKNSLNIDPKSCLEAESHLQSLGFVINNGKARFKLDDNMPTYSNMAGTDFSIIDTDDTLSFVVLGKDSLDSIQASSLASYVDIQQKSMSVDYNSMIASLNSTEIHQKLHELLQENEKLKETLKQNNVAMKQQFNTLATWQEEIMKIHQNHKKKFAETRELINYLKKENTELKMKLCVERTDNTEMVYKSIDATEVDEKVKEKETSIAVVELQEKVSSLSDELNNSQFKCAKLSSNVEKLLGISNLMSSQLKQATSTIQEQRLNIKKLELATTSSQPSGSNDQNQSIRSYVPLNQTQYIKSMSCENCSMKDKEINCLQESVNALELKLQHATAPVQFYIKNTSNARQYQQKHSHGIKQYNEILLELSDCFNKQIDRCSVIAKYLKELMDTLENTEVFGKSYTEVGDIDYVLLSDTTVLQSYRERLRCCYKQLIEEQEKLDEDRQNAIKAQTQFQNIVLDSNSVLHEMESALQENTKANEGKSISTNEVQKTANPEKQTTENKQLLNEERKILSQEKENLEEEKKVIINQKKSLDIEYQNLNDAKELLQQEKISLHEEKASLDQQSQLYEDHKKMLQMEKKVIEMKYDQLIGETSMLHESLQKKENNIKELERKIEQYVEEADLLQTQLKFYEEDFTHERKVKESLLEEKNKLDTDLQKQIEFNSLLQKEINRLKGLQAGNHSQHYF